MATLIDILKQFNPKLGLIKSAFLSMVENFYLYKITNLEKISGKQKPTQKTFKLKKLFRKNLSNSNSCINKTKQKNNSKNQRKHPQESNQGNQAHLVVFYGFRNKIQADKNLRKITHNKDLRI